MPWMYHGSGFSFSLTSSAFSARTMSMAPPSSSNGPPMTMKPAMIPSINRACSSQSGCDIGPVYVAGVANADDLPFQLVLPTGHDHALALAQRLGQRFPIHAFRNANGRHGVRGVGRLREKLESQRTRTAPRQFAHR